MNKIYVIYHTFPNHITEHIPRKILIITQDMINKSILLPMQTKDEMILNVHFLKTTIFSMSAS